MILWQGFDHRWTTLPHRIGGLGARLRKADAAVRMAPGQDADVGRAAVRWARVEIPGATRRVLRFRLHGHDTRIGASWSFEAEDTRNVGKGDSFAILRGFDWNVTADGGVSAVWAHRFALSCVIDGEQVRVRAGLDHADSPDRFKAPGAVRWRHTLDVWVDVLSVPGGEIASARHDTSVALRKPGGGVAEDPDGVQGITGFGWSLASEDPPGRYLDRYTFHLGEARVAARLPASVFVRPARCDAWLETATVRAAGARVVEHGWVVARTRRAGGYASDAAIPTPQGESDLEAPAAELLGGAATRPIVLPADGSISTAGYSLGSPKPGRASTPLEARALVLADSGGGRVAFVTLDVHSGTRLLHSRIARRLERRGIPIGAHQLLVSGTHTHTGPSHIYGNTLYDAITGSSPISPEPDPRAWKPIVEAATRAVVDAWNARRAVRVGYAEARASGVGHQRSVPAFPHAQTWGQVGMPGAGLAGDAHERLVDPRVRGWVVRDTGGALVAIHATVACHNTAMGFFDAWDHDWVGRATTDARQALGAVVLIGLSGAGDQSPLAGGAQGRKNGEKGQGAELAATRAAPVVHAIRHLADAVPVGSSVRVSTWFEDWEPSAAPGGVGGEDLRLASWQIGHAMAAGAEDYRSFLFPLLAKEGVRRKGQRPSEGTDLDAYLQWPKLPVAHPFQRLLGSGLAPAQRHPIHVVSIGGYTLATLPGEPTIATSWAVERALRTARGGEAGVLGYTGDYAGYLATEAEYDHQHYEGAATLYGRNTVAHLVALLVGLVAEGENRLVVPEAWTAEDVPPGYDPRVRPEDLAGFRVDGTDLLVTGSPLDPEELARHGLRPLQQLPTGLGTLFVAIAEETSHEGPPRSSWEVTVAGAVRSAEVVELD